MQPNPTAETVSSLDPSCRYIMFLFCIALNKFEWGCGPTSNFRIAHFNKHGTGHRKINIPFRDAEVQPLSEEHDTRRRG